MRVVWCSDRFLASPQPHNFLVDEWFRAVSDAVATLPDWASPDSDDINYRFAYHFVHCIFNQIYADRPAVHAAYEQVPRRGYCEQHGYNAVEWCAMEFTRLHPDFQVGPLGAQGYPTEEPDTAPDPAKFMYKGQTSLDYMNFDLYDAHVASVAAQAG